MLSAAEDELSDEIVALRALLARERRARNYRADVQKLLVDTADQVDPTGVADVIVRGFGDIVEAGWACIAFVSASDPNMAELVFGPTTPAAIVDDWAHAPLETSVPMTALLRGDIASAHLPHPSDFAPWPLMAAEAERAEMASFHCLPIPSSDGGPPIASIGLAWPHPHEMDDDERTLLNDVVSASASAFERARQAATDRRVAQTLQNWLLPPSIPDHERLDIATFYMPGHDEMSVGGDWYDVVRLDDATSAFVIGDVVGHNVRAAAEMGQVRHVLASSLLLTGGDPALSLQHTDDYFTRRATDTMATAIVMVVGIDDGTLRLASAGHLPPIVTDPGTASRLLEPAVGPPIGAGLGGYTNVERDLPAGALLTAFTDGVVERRGEVIDDSLLALCSDIDRVVALDISGSTSSAAAAVVTGLLEQRVRGEAASDDAAALVLRRL